MVLISTVLVAFAAVYPAAFKLNRKSHRAVQAAEIAGAVAEEIRDLPFRSPGLSIDDLTGWDPSDSRFAGFPRTPVPEPFTLMDSADPNKKGIVVQLTEATPGDGVSLAHIKVTIHWREPVNGRMTDRYVSVQSARTSNR